MAQPTITNSILSPQVNIQWTHSVEPLLATSRLHAFLLSAPKLRAFRDRQSRILPIELDDQICDALLTAAGKDAYKFWIETWKSIMDDEKWLPPKQGRHGEDSVYPSCHVLRLLSKDTFIKVKITDPPREKSRDLWIKVYKLNSGPRQLMFTLEMGALWKNVVPYDAVAFHGRVCGRGRGTAPRVLEDPNEFRLVCHQSITSMERKKVGAMMTLPNFRAQYQLAKALFEVRKFGLR